jgi:hypothetical protein
MPEPYQEIRKRKVEMLLYCVDSPSQGIYNAEVHEINGERGHWQVTFSPIGTVASRSRVGSGAGHVQSCKWLLYPDQGS